MWCELMHTDDDDCDEFYDAIKDTSFFKLLNNHTENGDDDKAPEFCTNFQNHHHDHNLDFRNSLLNSDDFE